MLTPYLLCFVAEFLGTYSNWLQQRKCRIHECGAALLCL